MSSWANHIDLADVTVLNHSNIGRLLGDLVDVESLHRFGFAKQSDIVSAAWLFKFGGAFLDIDTIMVNEAATDFVQGAGDSDVLRFFGNESSRGVHIGVLAAPPGSTLAARWVDALQVRVPRWREDRSWNYVGNAIIEPLINSPEYADFSLRIDVAKGLATPELQFSHLDETASAREKYVSFWFDEPCDDEVIDRIIAESAGLVSLHNSWTPARAASLGIDELHDAPGNLVALLGRVGNLALVADLQDRVYFGN